MTNAEKLQAFEDKKVRTVWVDEEEKWFFSVLDVIEVLTDSKDPTDYFKKMRKREEGLAEFVGTNCPQVEMLTTTGKRRKTLAGEMSVILAHRKNSHLINRRSNRLQHFNFTKYQDNA